MKSRSCVNGVTKGLIGSDAPRLDREFAPPAAPVDRSSLFRRTLGTDTCRFLGHAVPDHEEVTQGRAGVREEKLYSQLGKRQETRSSRGFGPRRRPTLAAGLPFATTMSPVKSLEPRISDDPTP